jgi:hypothetical protein
MPRRGKPCIKSRIKLFARQEAPRIIGAASIRTKPAAYTHSALAFPGLTEHAYPPVAQRSVPLLQARLPHAVTTMHIAWSETLPLRLSVRPQAPFLLCQGYAGQRSVNSFDLFLGEFIPISYRSLRIYLLKRATRLDSYLIVSKSPTVTYRPDIASPDCNEHVRCTRCL